MGEDEPSATTVAPAVTMERNSGSQIALALTVFALVLASNSVINESWLTSSIESEGQTTDSDMGLREISAEVCSGVTCESSSENLGDLYEDCMESMEGATSSEKGNTPEISYLPCLVICYHPHALRAKTSNVLL